MQIYFTIIYNLLRFSIMKMRYGKRLKVKFIQRVSMRSRIHLYDNSECIIADNIDVRPFCEFLVFNNAKLQIGAHTFFNRYCMISCHCDIKIGDNCLFAPSVKIFDNNHKFDSGNGVSQHLSKGTIEIGNNCWIGSNVVILKNTKIGNNCVIGAGCIVSGEIPDGSIMKMDKNNFTIEEIKK